MLIAVTNAPAYNTALLFITEKKQFNKYFVTFFQKYAKNNGG